MDRGRLGVVAALGTAQTLAWASSYYLPAILADPIAHDLGDLEQLVLCRVLGVAGDLRTARPAVGRADRRVGGRQVLCASNVVLAAGLALLGASTSIWMMSAAWLLLGIGMGLGLYDAAFARAGAHLRHATRAASITGITLIAGFASTVGWPLSSLWLETIGWRETCYAWAARTSCIGLPLNLLLPRTPQRIAAAEGPAVKPHIPIDRTMVDAVVRVRRRLDGDFCDGGASAAARRSVRRDAGAGGIRRHDDRAGPGRRADIRSQPSAPLPSARLHAARGLTHPIGACVIGIFGGGAAAAFALLHGAGNGILTIARGTLPLAIFGPENYAYRLGLIGAPSRICQALAPLAFGLLIDPMGRGVVVVSAGLSLAALIALMLLPHARPETAKATAAAE